MAEHGPGTSHSLLTGKDTVYTKEQCDKELDKKQDKIDLNEYQRKLKAGTGVEIKSDGTINCLTSQHQTNICAVFDINSNRLDETNEIEVSNAYHIYKASQSAQLIGPFKFKNIQELAGDNVYEIELWVTVADPTITVEFETENDDQNIVIVGDTDFHVIEGGQTIYFAVRQVGATTFINKYFVG